MTATRRQLMWGAGSLAGVLCLPTIMTRALAAPAEEAIGPLRGGEILPTPNFDQLRKTARFLAGVRPHRYGGVRLSLEEPVATAKGTKFLIHNYGHSGAGITLSWGCASKVRDHVQTVLREMRGAKVRPSVAVLGTGVIGLTVATELRRRWPKLPITVYAKSLDVTKTASFVAAGQFGPSQVCREYEADDMAPILEDYLRRSAARIRDIENSGRRLRYGVARRRNYTLDEDQPVFDDCTPADVVPAFRRGRLPFKDFNLVGREYRTWLINPRILLPRLGGDLKRDAVRFRTKDFQDLQQLHDLAENIVVNCTGYGAKKLFGDDALEARRGHVVLLRNPDRLKYFFSGGCQNHVISYLFARQTDIVVGGTIRYGDERDFFDPEDPADKETCNLLLSNVQKVFEGHPEGCTAPPRA